MKGCPFCEQLKNMLNENNIPFFNRDIDDHKSEYDDFKRLTGSEYVPALMILEGESEENMNSFFYVPERNYNVIEEAVEIIKKHNSKVM